MSSTPSDDCLATMQAFSNQFLEHRSQPGLALANSTNFSSHFLSEFCRILAFPIDYSADAQQSSLISNQYVQRLLSAQAALGFAGEYSSPSLPARVAQTIMNLRYIATSLYTFLRGKSPAESETKNPGKIDTQRSEDVSRTHPLTSLRNGSSCYRYGRLVDGPYNIRHRRDLHAGRPA